MPKPEKQAPPSFVKPADLLTEEEFIVLQKADPALKFGAAATPR